MEFLTQLKAYIEDQKLFQPHETVLLAVSGGVDSVVLTHALNKLKYSFAIAHCNFQLRSKESDEDEIFVEQLAKKISAPFFCKRFDTKHFSQKEGVSIQMAARQLRYTWFEEIKNIYGYASIVSAHHQNDVLETVLLNLVRGTGLAGFHGILPRNGNIVRPLLFATKQEVEAYAQIHNLDWREDSSNSANKYARNLIRNEVIPLLKKINPSLEKTIKQTAEKVGIAENQLKETTKTQKKKILSWQGQIGRIDIGLVNLESDPLFTLFSIIKGFGFEFEISKQILDSSERISGKIFYSSTHVLLKDRDDWLLTTNETDDFKISLLYPDTRKADLPGENYIKIRVIDGGAEMLNSLKTNATLFFDFDKLIFPLTIRRWEKGDIFFPYGMKGSKKISDVLINMKINVFDKKNIVILESQEEILGIVGYRSGNHYLVDKDTKRIWQATLAFPL